MFGGGSDPSNRGITNKLAAYDIHTGKLQWELGGQEALTQSDTFFLGPPLPLRGQLYVIAEIKGEMRLLALDGATGTLLWKQQLAMVEVNLTQDPIRRMAGISPSYSDGVLIVPPPPAAWQPSTWQLGRSSGAMSAATLANQLRNVAGGGT